MLDQIREDSEILSGWRLVDAVSRLVQGSTLTPEQALKLMAIIAENTRPAREVRQ